MKRCGNCGEKSAINTIHWKDFKNLELLKPIELLKCSNCGEIGFSAKEAFLIDVAAGTTLQVVTNYLISKILVNQKCNQGELACASPTQLTNLTTKYRLTLK